MKIFIASIGILGCSLADAIPVTSYSYDLANACDNRCYYDSNSTKLTDGFYATGYAQYNAGEGWVGWRIGENERVNIDFSFSAPVELKTISISSIGGYGNTNPLFSISVLDSFGNWNRQLPQSKTWSDHFLSVDGSFLVRDKVRIEGASLDGWLLVDEIKFDGTAINTVPTPSSGLLLLAGLASLFLLGPKGNHKRPLG